MTTTAEIEEAHRGAPRHRFALRDLIKVDESKATAADLELVGRIKAATTPAAFDALWATTATNGLYRRGVIYFGDRHAQ